MNSKTFSTIKKSEISSVSMNSTINVIFKMLTIGLISSETTVSDFSRVCNEYLEMEKEMLKNKSNNYELD